MATTYSTRTEAIEREIVAPIELDEGEGNAYSVYDVDAIADKVLGDHAQGYACIVEPDVFWKIACDHVNNMQ